MIAIVAIIIVTIESPWTLWILLSWLYPVPPTNWTILESFEYHHRHIIIQHNVFPHQHLTSDVYGDEKISLTKDLMFQLYHHKLTTQGHTISKVPSFPDMPPPISYSSPPPSPPHARSRRLITIEHMYSNYNLPSAAYFPLTVSALFYTNGTNWLQVWLLSQAGFTWRGLYLGINNNMERRENISVFTKLDACMCQMYFLYAIYKEVFKVCNV